MNRPYMPLYVGDLTRDTTDLSAAEFGAYMRLIVHYWAKGGLPEDDQRLARIAGMSEEEWQCVRICVSSFFASGWQHKRVDKELEKVANKSQKARESANNRWKDKDKQENANAYANADASAMLTRTRIISSSLRSEESSLRSESSVSEKPIRTRKRKTSNSRIEYPPDFERFWRGYPTDSNMSKAEALPEWEKLDAVDREAAERSLPGFRAYCSKNPDYRPVHANRYLKRRRFDGHLAANGHDGSAPARSKKEGVLSWWMDGGMSRKEAEELWEKKGLTEESL